MKLEQRTVTLPSGETITSTRGSDNVFADMGLPDAEELQWKARLLDEIGRIVQSKGLTQQEIARRAGLNRSEVSRLVNGRISTFSVERLLVVLNRLGHSVEMRVASQEVAPEKARTVIKTVAKVA